MPVALLVSTPGAGVDEDTLVAGACACAFAVVAAAGCVAAKSGGSPPGTKPCGTPAPTGLVPVTEAVCGPAGATAYGLCTCERCGTFVRHRTTSTSTSYHQLPAKV